MKNLCVKRDRAPIMSKNFRSCSNVDSRAKIVPDSENMTKSIYNLTIFSLKIEFYVTEFSKIKDNYLYL